MPQFDFNLLSVSALTNASKIAINFFPDHFLIQEIPSKRTIGRGKTLEGLYVLDSSSTEFDLLKSHFMAYANKVSIQTWHNRLGHLSPKCLDLLKDQLDCNKSSFTPHSPCYICPLAK